MSRITGKYIFIAHGKQLSVEKYDYDYNFESLSFFVPAGYVLENPSNASTIKISQTLCDNKLNLDRISKVPRNDKLNLRKMAFTASDNDKLPGHEVFYYNTGLYYCDSNNNVTKILDWEDIKSLKLISFKKLFSLITDHAVDNGINPETTGIFLYACRSSNVEPRKGYITPTLLPLSIPDKIIGIGGPSIKQLRNKLNPILPTHTGGTTFVSPDIPDMVNVDEDTFYRYNSVGGSKSNRKSTKNKKRRKSTKNKKGRKSTKREKYNKIY